MWVHMFRIKDSNKWEIIKISIANNYCYNYHKIVICIYFFYHTGLKFEIKYARINSHQLADVLWKLQLQVFVGLQFVCVIIHSYFIFYIVGLIKVY